jgi:hypothetical protein
MNDYIAKIINNNHTELKKRDVGSLINLTLDEDKVYVYSFPSERLNMKEVMWEFSLEEAKKYVTCLKKSTFNSKDQFMKKSLIKNG